MSRATALLLTAVFAAALTVSCACAAGDGLLVSVPRTPAGPTIDGQITPAEWAAASGPAAFTDLASGLLAPAQPQVLLMWDSQALYVAARLPLPRSKVPAAAVRQRDGNLWEDDAVEVFLAPAGPGGDYFQVIANSASVIWDSQGRDSAWSSDVQVMAATDRDAWGLEMAIPFAALGVEAPEPGAVWGANFAWDRKTPAPLNVSWAHLAGNLHDPGNFGALRFVTGGAAVQVTGMRDATGGKAAVEGTWSAPVPTQASLTVTRAGDAGTAVEAVHAGGGSSAPLRLENALPRDGSFVAAGRYSVALTVREGDAVTYRAEAPCVVAPPLAVKLSKYILEGKLNVAVDPAGLDRDLSLVGLKATVLNAAGKVVAEKRLPGGGRGEVRTAVFDLANLPAGDYQVAVTARDILGRLIRKETVDFKRPAVPEWLNSKAGLSDEVLAPWTPVQVAGDTFSVWGRSYEVGPLPLPTSVTTDGVSLLAGPVSLRMVTDGKEQSWREDKPLKVSSATPARACLSTSAAGAGVRCEGQVAAEYDGMLRSDLTLSFRGAKQVDQLSLVIPIKEQYARYLYHFPGNWGSAYNAEALPAEGFTAGFRPYVWLGDESRGLAWFCETDEGFVSSDPARVTVISRADGVVTLQVNIIQAPAKVSGNMKFTFGFQATPVKPLQPDVWDYRICHEGGYGIETMPWTRPATITYPAEGNIRLEQGTFEAWVRPQFDPKVAVDPQDPSRGIWNRSLFSVDLSGAQIDLYWNIDVRGLRAFYRRGNSYPLMLDASCDWEKGQWHHVALTWGDKTRLYIDGKLAKEADFQGTLPGASLAEGRITLGQGVGEPCEFDVDEVHISDIARESFDIAQARKLDDHTLLLDRLDADVSGPGEVKTVPDRGLPGVVRGPRRLNGVWGYGLALHGDSAPMTRLDRLAELGVRTVCFHEHWTDIQNYTSTTHGEELRKLVSACHERGIKLLLYFGYEISDIAPEYEDYAAECLTWPRQGGYTRQPPQTAYVACYQGKWQDFMAEGIARMMDEYGIDGVYLDGTAYPWGCQNLRHGCGYEKPDGTVGTTWPIFATRDMMRRIYTIVKSRKPEGEVNVHNSTMLVAPTLSWATSTWDGEQFGSLPRSTDPMKCIPLDAFRAEFMGRQLGVPAEFLCYEQPYTYRQAMAFTLLHDVLVRGSLGPNLELESALWKGMEEFGRQGSVWMPYWEPSNYVQTGPDDSIKASLYSRAENGAVVVVSNLGKEPRTAMVRLDLEGLALPAQVQAADMATGFAVSVSPEGRMAFPLESLDFRVVRITPR
jgi:hypothetical protein